MKLPLQVSSPGYHKFSLWGEEKKDPNEASMSDYYQGRKVQAELFTHTSCMGRSFMWAVQPADGLGWWWLG
jgi:hypothetical protein